MEKLDRTDSIIF